MPHRILLSLLLIWLALPAAAVCNGQNLIAALDPATRASLIAAADAQPYPRGNFWRATRGTEVVHLVGTYHLDDPRLDPYMPTFAPLIAGASVVLVEAGPAEQTTLAAEIARRPDFMFITEGPTLPEQLPEAEWQTLADAMRARNIPPFLASKFQPWYVAMILGVAPCAIKDMNKGARGLDERIIIAAGAAEVPIRALEPYDTIFGIFGGMPAEDQLDMIRAALLTADQAEDFAATLIEAYLAEDTRLIWEFSRLQALRVPGESPEKVDAELAILEEALMKRRNRVWIPVIEAAAAEGPVFAAFGALHLSGHDGVLDLLEQRGFTLERLKP